MDGEDNVNKQFLDIEYMVNNGTQSIVLVPVDSQATYFISDSAEK